MIKKSITRRLFIQITALVLSFSILLLLSNTLLIRPIYYRSIETTMVDAMEELKQLEFTNPEVDWIAAINEIEVGNAFDIIIEHEGAVIYSSSSEVGLLVTDKEGNTDKAPEDNGVIEDTQDVKKVRKDDGTYLGVADWNEVKADIYMGVSSRKGDGTEIMICSHHLNDATNLFVSQPIEPINSNIVRTNILLLVCTSVFIIASMIIAFRMAKQFTDPIKRIQYQVGQLTQLNFSHKQTVNTEDEIQSLSEDVNNLSDRLETTLETLKNQNIQLEKDIVSQKKLLSNVSHELRTPLSLIKGYAEEVKAGYITDSEQQKMIIEYISEESTKMSRLLNEILDLSRLESGRMAFNYEKVNVNEVIQNFLWKYDGFISQNNLQVGTNIDEALNGHMDTMRFEQILANYIANASKYGDLKKEIRIFTTDESDSVRIHVFNSGKPIPKTTLEHLWDDFYKVDESRSSDKESFGLGLSIVKAIQEIAKEDYGVYNTDDGNVLWFDVKKVII